MDMPDFIENLKTEIKAGPVIVTFRKKDKTVRRMLCTQNPEHIVKIYEATNDVPTVAKKAINYDQDKTARVFDLEINEWRSFNYDSVLGFKKP